MRDVDDARSGRAKPGDDAEELLRLARGEAGGGLVHGEDGDVLRDRLGDFDELLLPRRERSGAALHVDADAEPLDKPGRVVRELPPVDEGAALRLAPEVDVLRHGEVRREAQLLVDDAHPGADGVAGTAPSGGLSPYQDLPFVGSDHAAEYLDEGGLPRAVFADERMEFPRAQGV